MSNIKKYDKIEDAINELLDGELKETALTFVAYLNENQLALKMPEYDCDFHFAKIQFDNHYLGWIVVETDKWLYDPFNLHQYGDFVDDDEDFVAAVHEHINPCTASCGCCPNGKPCELSREATIFGKKFTNVCFQHAIGFENPDEKTLGYIKNLINYSKKVTPHKAIYHCNNL